MMVIAAGREKQRAGIIPYHLVQTERVVIERLGLPDVADVQVDVTDRGPLGRSGPRLIAGRGDDTVDVEWNRGHAELPLLLAPSAARPVRVHLDAEVVRILEIDRFAHEVIRHAGVRAQLAKMLEKPPQRR